MYITLGSFILFTGFVGLITWLLTRGKHDDDSADGFFLAGRSLSAGVIAGSLLLTNLSTEQLVGLNGAAYQDGLSVMAWEVVAAASLVLMAIFFLPRYLQRGITTVPQFLRRRFSGTTEAITNGIFIIAYTAILLPIILYTGATALVDMLDFRALIGVDTREVAVTVMVWLVGIIGSIYALGGGLRSVAISDLLNGFGLLAGGLLIVYFGLQEVNEGGIFAALTELKAQNPQKFNSIGQKGQSVPFSTLFTGVLLLNLFYWTTNQQIIQRTFAASELAEGQKGVLLAAFFKILAPIVFVLPGIIAYHLYSERGIEPDQAYGTLVRDVLPAPLTGFFAAVLVGAILSSFNSALNSTATLFSLGFYKPVLRRDATDRQTVKAGQIFGIIVAVAAMVIAPMLLGQESIFGYLQKMNGLYFIPIFAVVLVAMLTRRVPAIAANVALVVGFTAIAVGYFVPPFPEYVAWMHEFHFLGIVFVSLLLLMVIFGLVIPRELPAGPTEEREVPPIDMTPWRAAPVVGALLFGTVLAIYIFFAR